MFVSIRQPTRRSRNKSSFAIRATRTTLPIAKNVGSIVETDGKVDGNATVDIERENDNMRTGNDESREKRRAIFARSLFSRYD